MWCSHTHRWQGSLGPQATIKQVQVEGKGFQRERMGGQQVPTRSAEGKGAGWEHAAS